MTSTSSVSGEKIELKYSFPLVPSLHIFLLPFPKWQLYWHLHRERGEVCRATGQGRKDTARQRVACRSKCSCKCWTHPGCSVPVHPCHPRINSSYGFAGGRRVWSKTMYAKTTQVSTPFHGKQVRARFFHSPIPCSCAELALQETQIPAVQAHC